MITCDKDMVDYREMLDMISDVREKAISKGINPRIYRQVIVETLELDTRQALDAGISRATLDMCDRMAKDHIKELIALNNQKDIPY